MMREINEFYNQGFGWICKRCEQDWRVETIKESDTTARVWREGEAESKQPKLSAPLAKWFDSAKTQLVCPRCGISEAFDKA